jgi:hypothetical protein
LEGNTKQNELNSLSERIEEYKRIRSRDKFHTEKGLLEIRKIL